MQNLPLGFFGSYGILLDSRKSSPRMGLLSFCLSFSFPIESKLQIEGMESPFKMTSLFLDRSDVARCARWKVFIYHWVIVVHVKYEFRCYFCKLRIHMHLTIDEINVLAVFAGTTYSMKFSVWIDQNLSK